HRRRWTLHRHPGGTAGARPADFQRPALLQRVRDRAWPDHDLLHDHAGDDWRLRQLAGAADDRRARYGVPTHEQHFVLAAAGLVHAAADFDVRSWRAGHEWRGYRMDALRAAVDLRKPGAVGRFRDPVDPPCGRLLDPRRHQLHHHDLQHARARHDDAQDAAVRVVDP